MRHTIVFLVLLSPAVFANDSVVCFAIGSMTCGSCEKTVEIAVKNLPGISSVDASSEKNTASVHFDQTKTNKGAIEKAIDDTGFSASAIECPQ